jgi:HAE1 family hydrophobic/amphiphilic exporter-1
MMLIPVLSSHYLPLTSRRQRPLRGVIRRIDDGMAGVFTGLDNAYKRAVSGVLNHKVITILIVVLIFGGAAYTLKDAPFEFLPSQAQDSVTLEVEMPLGTKLEETEAVLKQMEQVVKEEIEAYDKVILQVGQRGMMGFFGGVETHRGSLQIELPEFEERAMSADQVQQQLRGHFNEFPGAVFSFGGNQGMALGGTNPIDIIVKTSDLEKGKTIAEQIRTVMDRQVPQVTEPSVDMRDGLPELEIVMDRDKLYSLGLTIAGVGNEIQANIDGVVASRYQEEGSEYDILLTLEEEDRDELLDLDQIFVTNNSGTRIPLASFASYEKTTGPVDIQRENQSRVIHVTGGIVPGAALNEVEMKVRSAIKEQIPTEEDVTIQFSGEYQDLLKYGQRLIYILLVAVFLVFGVMASQFESFLDPFIILFTVPLSLIGVIALYVSTGETYSLLTAVGLVMLAGIIVNNGIVLVDYTNLLRKRGLSIREACIEAGGNRLRPILMTTFTTVLALVPMAFFPGEGSELVSPIAKTVVGGLTVGALMTLFLVPVIYAIFNRMAEKRQMKKKEKRRRRRERRRQLEAQKPWEAEA